MPLLSLPIRDLKSAVMVSTGTGRNQKQLNLLNDSHLNHEGHDRRIMWPTSDYFGQCGHEPTILSSVYILQDRTTSTHQCEPFWSLDEIMGIQGLKKLLKESAILEDIELHDSLMIIDGSSLYFCLYFHEQKLDQSHGGDYSGFKAEVRRFFKALTDCDIKPHVVLEGGTDPEKQETLKDRLQDKIKKAVNTANGEQRGGDGILPPLIKDIFKQILIEENIPFSQSFGEADPVIVRLANEKGCPVLSNDSGFYIHDLKGGVIPPYPWTQWKPKERRIHAKLYRRSRFCEKFNVDADLIPVLASIAGNDYSRLEDGGKFVGRYPPTNPTESQGLSRLRAILDFLRDLNLPPAESTEQKQKKAVAAALRFVGEEDRLLSPDRFLRSIKTYIIPPELTSPPDDLPEWMRKLIRKGTLNTFVIDVICQKKIMLTPLVDDFTQPSSYRAAGQIRQFFYGLLIGEERCTEFDRDGVKVRQQEIKPLLPRDSEDKLTNLCQHGPVQAPEGFCLEVFLDALGLDSEILRDISDDMKLPLCVTNFWWTYRQKHHPSVENIHHLKALLLWFVCGEDCNADGVRVEGERPKPVVAHAFNQWQCCFIASLHLNQLLGRPLKEPDCARIYCGPVVHQLVDELQGGSSPEQLGLRTQDQQLFRDYQTKCQLEGWTYA